jgi:hypothetical protein
LAASATCVAASQWYASSSILARFWMSRELELVDRERVATAKELLRRIVGMLVGLGKWMENAAP